MSNTVQCPQVHVLINRGSEVLNVHVPAHEVPILKLVHGSMSVKVKGDSEASITLAANADAEWVRLQRKYRRINSPDPVNIAFRVVPSRMNSTARTTRRIGARQRLEASA